MKIILLIGSVQEGFTYNSTLELSKRSELYVFHSTKIKEKFLIKGVSYHFFKSSRLSNINILSFDFLKQTLLDFLRSRTISYFKMFRYNFNLFKSIYLKSEFLLSELSFLDVKKNDVKFISFWMDDNSTLLSLLKKRKKITKAFSLAHGRDLFEWREPRFGILPFKRFQMKYLDKVFSVSVNGANYLRKRYPKFKEKVDVFYLGSYDFGISYNSSDVFTIISCSDIKPIKRVHLIADALSLCYETIKWFHIGDLNYSSDELALLKVNESIKKLKKNKNVNFKLLGSIDNKSFMDIYKTQSIDLFINVSTTEGLPFSMIEASSFGVPIISTNAGGCSEIVDDYGVILPINLTPTLLADEIQSFMFSSKNNLKNKKKVRDNWDLKFNIEKNFNKLITIID